MLYGIKNEDYLDDSKNEDFSDSDSSIYLSDDENIFNERENFSLNNEETKKNYYQNWMIYAKFIMLKIM